MSGRISVIIVSFQNPDGLERCLRTLVQPMSDEVLEVIVVDNSTRDEMKLFEAHFPEVRFFWNSENIGFAPACNQGAKVARGEFLLFLNPDTEVPRGALFSLLGHLEGNGELGAVGPLSNFAGGWQNMHYHIPKDPLLNNTNLVFDWLLKNKKGQIKEVKLLVGFCFLMSTQLFTDIGGMDPGLILGMDDLDLSWRIRQSGKKLAVVLDSFVYHKGQESFNKLPNERRAEMEKKSKEHFAKKLAEHFGSAEEIPESWDLWEVDWFNAKEHLAEKKEFGVALLWQNETKEEMTHTLRNLEEILPDQKQILIFNASKHRGLESEKLDICEIKKEWSQKDLPSLKKVLQLVEEDFVFLLRPGFYLTKTLWQNIPLMSKESYFIVESEKSLENLTFENWVSEKHPALLFNKSNLTEERSFLNAGLVMPSFANIYDFKEMQNEDLELWSDGISLFTDASKKKESQSTPRKLNLELRAGQLNGLHIWLRDLRLKGLKEVTVEFKNSLCPTFVENHLFQSDALDPRKVRRELLLAGFRDLSWEKRGQEKKYSTDYFGVESAIEYAFPEERKLRFSETLKVIAHSCAEDYDLNAKVSIVLLAYNQLEYTIKCLDSIRNHCRQNVELIVVNNGSSDGTKEYLDAQIDLKVIHNQSNLGVAAGWNQGMDAATGAYFLILNNDVIVPPKAIENLVRTAQNHPSAGIIAPRSNKIAGPQVLHDFQYESESEIVPKLLDLQNESDLSCWDFHRIKGFCLLIPRATMAKVGYFDEGFGKGNFEDDDYSVRVQYAGYELLVADDSIIFHYGSVSFRNADVDWQELMRVNQGRFNKKWDKGRASAANVFAPEQEPLLTEEILLSKLDGNPTDSEIYLQLAELKKADHEKEKAFHYYVCALEKKPDSQEVSSAIMEFLKDNFLLEECKDVLHYLSNRFPLIAVFRGEEQHTQNENFVDYSKEMQGFFEAENFEAAQAFLNANAPQIDPQQRLLFQGLLHYYRGEFSKAFTSFGEFLKQNPTDEDALFNYFDTGVKLKLYQAVADRLDYALSIDPEMKEIRRLLQELKFHQQSADQNSEKLILDRELNLKAENCIREGMLDEALVEIEKILDLDDKQFRALNNLGLIFWYQGHTEQAKEMFSRAVAENLFYTDAVLNLYDVCVLSKDLAFFKPVFEQALRCSPENEELLKVKKELDLEEIPTRLKKYYQEDQDRQNSLSEMQKAKLHLENRELDKATHAFLDLLEKDPENAEAYNALGIIAYYWKQYGEAWRLIRHSLTLRLLDEDALLNLWDVASEVGKQAEAIQLMREAVDLEPNLKKVVHFLEEIQ